MLSQVQRDHYRGDDLKKNILAPVVKSKGQSRDFALDYRNRSPKYILGYTGNYGILSLYYFNKLSRSPMKHFKSIWSK